MRIGQATLFRFSAKETDTVDIRRGFTCCQHMRFDTLPSPS